jgi:predicted enzyme related to lactoylglutathione lyase
MANPDFVLLYVDSPAKSVPFYEAILGKPPVESSPNFAMFPIGGGAMLGLWARKDVQPAPSAPGGGELGITLESDDAVRALHAAWVERGVAIAQAPTRMDFGFTFVGLDPDGHRLRVFAPSP